MGGKALLRFFEGDEGVCVEEFAPEEAKQLEGVVSSTEGTVFGWKIGERLTPEQAGALLSRYSRTSLTGRRLFLKEFLPNRERGREFFESWLVDYGDDSIQEMAGGIPLSCEFVSNLAVKEIEDNRMGSYIEKSSRYVFFDKKLPNGEYMFYKDPDIMNSRFGERYLRLMRGLFESYTKYMEKMTAYMKERNSFDAQTFRIGAMALKPSEITKGMEEYGITEEDLKKAYDNAAKANALDFMRDYLPMATLTHVGISMNARSYENLVIKLRASPLAEARKVGNEAAKELAKIIPSLMRRVDERHGNEYVEFLSKKRRLAEELSSKIWGNSLSRRIENATLIEYTGRETNNPNAEAEIRLAAAILYRFGSGCSYQKALDKAKTLDPDMRDELIRAYVGERLNRRHKPGRAFENIEYLFGLVGRTGIYRDIQRHRIGTQERQDFTVKLGYKTRDEFKAIGIAEDYESKMAEVVELFNDLRKVLPHQSQYVVTYGFNTGWYYRMNARQLFHLCELRSTPSGHPDYRALVQDMFYKVSEVHPCITQHMNFMNLEKKELGRIDSEIRIAIKRKEMDKGAGYASRSG